MIHASEAREIVNGLSREMYERIVDYVHQSIVSSSKKGYTRTVCRLEPDLFEQYGEELIDLLKKSGYHVGELMKGIHATSFTISWEKRNPFHEDSLELPRWSKFCK